MTEVDADVIVVGAGNAALCAALAAREHGARVIVLEAAPEEESGGNSRYTAGLFRIPYAGMKDLENIIPDLSDDEKENTDFGQYTREEFFDDMARVTQYRANPDLLEIMVNNAHETGVCVIPFTFCFYKIRTCPASTFPFWCRYKSRTFACYKIYTSFTTEPKTPCVIT